MNADTSPLKRSFVEAWGQELFGNTPIEGNGFGLPSLTKSGCRHRSHPPPAKRRSISFPETSIMSKDSSSVGHPTFPTFMSIFGSGGPDQQRDARRETLPDKSQHGSSGSITTIHSLSHIPYPLPGRLQYRNSVHSFASDSTESSPSTTISTFGSPAITDPSPSSSPESPTSTLPLSTYKPMMRSSVVPNTHYDSAKAKATYSSPSDPSRAESPQVAGRNVKNLSLNTSATAAVRPGTSPGLDGYQPFSAPTSPLPQEPLKTGRRKPANLTIRTPGFEQLTFPRNSTDVPPTPNQRPVLHTFQSSPSLPSLVSPAAGPVGGMRLPLPLPPFAQSHSRPGSLSNLPGQSLITNLGDVTEEDPPEPSQEVQERGYTAGPVMVYDSGVYLYLEPSVEEARKFDTVINVAKEIKNPFETSQGVGDTVMSIWRAEEDRSKIPEPQTAVSEISFKSAFEWPQSSEITSPTTSRPPSTVNRNPEYVHVPWDHNSEIIEDLFPLCKIIDERVAAGKTVLVHCQLGVSRSASLVIAYGLYKGYHTNFHQMYGSVKERSQWVGPNMSLIYQLGDFRRQVEKGDHINSTKEAPSCWFLNKARSECAITPTMSTVLPLPPKSVPESVSTKTPPSPVKVLPPLRLNKRLPPVPLFPRDEPPPPSTSPTSQPSPISVAASTLPAGVPAPSFLPPEGQSSPKQAAHRPLPLRVFSPTTEIPPHRPRESGLPGLMNAQPIPQMDLALRDVPSTPSLFSPRSTEFLASSFGQTAAGDLHTGACSTLVVPVSGSVETGERSPAEVDPRSPHQRDDSGEILRHIDDFL